MKPILLIIALLFSARVFADDLVLENLTSYPKKNAKMMVQWADTSKEIEEENQALVAGSKLNSNKMQPLLQSGKVKLAIPPKAEYFRVLVWSKEEENPDLHTNWVQIIPNKTYPLKEDHLVPSVLMSGMGC